MSDMDPTSEGKRLIESWLAARKHAARIEQQLDRANADLRETEQALAKWMLPDDAEAGETIAVWYGDSLIAVTAGPAPRSFGGASIVVRSRGKHMLEAGH